MTTKAVRDYRSSYLATLDTRNHGQRFLNLLALRTAIMVAAELQGFRPAVHVLLEDVEWAMEQARHQGALAAGVKLGEWSAAA